MLESLLDLGDYLHKVFGGELKIISQSIESDGLVGISTTEFSANITDKVSGIADLIFPPVMEVEDVTPQPEGMLVQHGASDVSGHFDHGGVFCRQRSVQSNFWTEKEKGTLGRWVASPNAFSAFWIAQWFTAMFLTAIVAAPIMLVGFFYFDISFEKYFTSLAWLALTGPVLVCTAVAHPGAGAFKESGWHDLDPDHVSVADGWRQLFPDRNNAKIYCLNRSIHPERPCG